MKFDFFQTFGYGVDTHELTWPTPARHCDPTAAAQSFDDGFEQCALAHDVGFDSLTLAEHHYTPHRLSPNPIPLAAALGRLLPSAQIGVFGTDLPLNNPVRIAEEFALLDNVLHGRLRVGLLRGTPNEYLTYGTNPWESRDRFVEALALVRRALTEPEPFAWEGVHYRFRHVSVWPRCVQQPHPPMLLSGNSAESAALAGRLGCDLGFSYQDVDRCAAHIAVYREAAAAAGWEPTGDNIQYRHAALVVETETEAAALRQRYGPESVVRLFPPATPELGAVLGTVGAAMGGSARGLGGRAEPPPTLGSVEARPAFTFAPPFVGTPTEIVEQVRRFHEATGVGRFEFMLGVGAHRPAHRDAMAMLRLLGAEVLPALRSGRY
ncbi:MAG: LLM class flavin-dependent oxidoreductase [Acidimicrobiia bacterium]|nr:LLM class flavin-dependent oxidoreductase [Acidimicrobiia bacterium]